MNKEKPNYSQFNSISHDFTSFLKISPSFLTTSRVFYHNFASFHYHTSFSEIFCEFFAVFAQFLYFPAIPCWTISTYLSTEYCDSIIYFFVGLFICLPCSTLSGLRSVGRRLLMWKIFCTFHIIRFRLQGNTTLLSPDEKISRSASRSSHSLSHSYKNRMLFNVYFKKSNKK